MLTSSALWAEAMDDHAALCPTHFARPLQERVAQVDQPAKPACLQPPTPHCLYLYQHYTKTVFPSYKPPNCLSLRPPSRGMLMQLSSPTLSLAPYKSVSLRSPPGSCLELERTHSHFTPSVLRRNVNRFRGGLVFKECVAQVSSRVVFGWCGPTRREDALVRDRPRVVCH